MGVIQDQREKVAAVVGAKIANDFSDEQLPAILHAIDGDEHEVRVIAQQCSRPDVKSPAALMIYKLRERKHTGLIPPRPTGPAMSTAPPLPTPEELEINKQRSRDWKRIQSAIMRRQDLKDLYEALTYAYEGDASRVRTEMIEALDELNQEARK